MFSYNMLYLVELVVVAIAILTLVLVFKLKHKKGVLKFVGIILGVFLVAFGATFVMEKPQMHIKEIANIEVNSESKFQKPYTYYHFREVTDDVKINSEATYDKIGEYEVEYVIDTILGKYSKKAKINVVDSVAPEITLEGEENFNQSYKSEYVEPGFKAIDAYEGDLTEKVDVAKKEVSDTKYDIVYKVQDSSGNEAEKVRHITIIDDIAPVISLKGNSQMTVYLGNSYQEKGATAEDEKDGDLTGKITTSGSVDTSKEGTYTITYTVSDNSGNEAKKERKVIVAKKAEVATTPIKAQDGTNGNKGVIYLTFDDGPTTSSTPKVLDILKAKGVKATFFILNYNSEGEKLVQREYNEGHTVAIHGYSHQYGDIYTSEEAYMNNLKKLQDKIKASIGYTATITRFPGGSSNTVSKKYNKGIMTRLCKLVVESGYTYFDWNVSSGDAGGAKTSSDVYNNVIKGLSKNKQNVVLMHDFASNNKTIGALADIIDYGLANGYTFMRITEDTPMVTHTPNN